MKNPFKKSSSELDINSIGQILSSGAAAGIAIAKFGNKRESIGGIIGAGLCLLITGLIAATDDNLKQQTI